MGNSLMDQQALAAVSPQPPAVASDQLWPSDGAAAGDESSASASAPWISPTSPPVFMATVRLGEHSNAAPVSPARHWGPIDRGAGIRTHFRLPAQG